MNRGFTLIEVLGALVILCLVVLTLITTLSYVQKSHQTTLLTQNAYDLAHEKLLELQASSQSETARTCETIDRFRMCWSVTRENLHFGSTLRVDVEVSWSILPLGRSVKVSGLASSRGPVACRNFFPGLDPRAGRGIIPSGRIRLTHHPRLEKKNVCSYPMNDSVKQPGKSLLFSPIDEEGLSETGLGETETCIPHSSRRRVT